MIRVMDDVDGLSAFACPRCSAEVRERFYGPCTTCRVDMRRTIRGEAREVETDAYAPKMNVVPNQVATKD
jgi:hypothetical protein